jgi:DNA polymerase III epsilon subunit-like protein
MRDEPCPDRVCGLLGPAAHRHWSDPASLAGHLMRLLADTTIIGAVPSFDAGFLSAMLARHGQPAQPWHYRLRDIGSMARGWLTGAALPCPQMDASTDEFAAALGVDMTRLGSRRHSAAGDCELVEAMLDKMRGGPF